MKLEKNADRLYAWEGRWASWSGSELGRSLKHTKEWVSWACKQYRVPVPSVKWSKEAGYPFYFIKNHTIYVKPKLNNVSIALHEAAHAICYKLFGTNINDHGKEFGGVYLWLLREARVAPEIALTASASADKVKFISLDDAAPIRIRKTQRKKLVKKKKA